MYVVRTLLSVVLLSGLALAHKPQFPGSSPVVVRGATVSQAFYIGLPVGETFVFEIAPLPRAVPVQVLVLDDEAGRALVPRALWRCGDESRILAQLDQPFVEAFSGLRLRYRVADSLDPTATPCRLEVWETHAAAGPLVVAIGDEERFDLGDLVGLLSLQGRLRAWQRGE